MKTAIAMVIVMNLEPANVMTIGIAVQIALVNKTHYQMISYTNICTLHVTCKGVFCTMLKFNKDLLRSRLENLSFVLQNKWQSNILVRF